MFRTDHFIHAKAMILTHLSLLFLFISCAEEEKTSDVHPVSPQEPTEYVKSSDFIMSDESLKTAMDSINSIEALFTFVEEQKPHHRFTILFFAGEYRFSNLSLEQISRDLQPYNPDYQLNFFDGIAHGRDWSRKSIKEQRDEILSTVPSEIHDRLLNGLIMFKISLAMGDLDQINSSILEFEKLFDSIELRDGVRDGVRVGFQRSVGHLTEKALLKSQSFPEYYQSAVVEELGWRVGNDFFTDFLNQQWDLRYAEETRCKYRQGISRGRSMLSTANGNLKSAIKDVKSMGPSCNAHKWIGFGVGLNIHMMSLEDIDDSIRPNLSIENYNLLLHGYTENTNLHMADISPPESTLSE
jgi:hypothetical protein